MVKISDKKFCKKNLNFCDKTRSENDFNICVGQKIILTTYLVPHNQFK